MFPVGLLIMLTTYGSQYLWTTTIFLGLQCLTLFLVMIKSGGVIKAILLTIILLLVSYAVEYIGVTSGYPFGTYSYTSVLNPSIMGIPVAITFAWYSVSVSSYYLTTSLFGKAGAFAASFVSSILILATDILLEPFAAFINGFWLWSNGRIPFQNFISWFALGFIFSLVISLFVKPVLPADDVSVNKIPPLVFSVNILMFLIINILFGYIMLSVVAVIVIMLITLIIP